MEPKLNDTVSLRSNQSFKKDVKDLFVDWLEHTTSHGLPNIIRARNGFIRLVWSLVFIVSLGYCCKVIVTSLMDFYDYKTTISTEYVRETPIPFPAVTFCNLNPFNETMAAKYIYHTALDVYDPECLGDGTDSEKWFSCLNSSTQATIQYLFYKVKRSLLNTLEPKEIRKYGFKLSGMLLNCEYNGMQCNETWFNEFWHNDYGLCYTFNSGLHSDVLITTVTGPYNGLQLELAVEPSTETMLAFRTGIYVLVHNQTRNLLNLCDGQLVATELETYIGVSRSFITKQEYPYSNCIKDLSPFSDDSKLLFSYFHTMNVTEYDQILCLGLCFQSVMLEKCGCCSSMTYCLGDNKFCENFEDYKCETEVKILFLSSDINLLCKDVCRSQCSTVLYDLKTSFASFPTTTYNKVLKNVLQPNRIFPAKSILKLIVNYNVGTYTSIIENKSVTVESLIGNVGGQLGLFIGISLLSLLEILEILSDILILAYRRFIKRDVTPLVN